MSYEKKRIATEINNGDWHSTNQRDKYLEYCFVRYIARARLAEPQSDEDRATAHVSDKELGTILIYYAAPNRT
jgi:hypothetical protein